MRAIDDITCQSVCQFEQDTDDAFNTSSLRGRVWHEVVFRNMARVILRDQGVVQGLGFRVSGFGASNPKP